MSTDQIPRLRVKPGTKVAPGDRIGSARTVQPGAGTYIRGGHIFASAVGTLTLQPLSQQEATTENDAKSSRMAEAATHEVSIVLEKGRNYASSQVLAVGHKVLGKIVRIQTQHALVEIVASEDVGGLKEHHWGIIRKEDVRVAATEEVSMYDCFRPSDIVLAKIISLGDSRRYFLSTAENELGVIRALSPSGEVMVPLNWKEMECPKTKIKELRKVAKPKE